MNEREGGESRCIVIVGASKSAESVHSGPRTVSSMPQTEFRAALFELIRICHILQHPLSAHIIDPLTLDALIHHITYN